MVLVFLFSFEPERSLVPDIGDVVISGPAYVPHNNKSLSNLHFVVFSSLFVFSRNPSLSYFGEILPFCLHVLLLGSFRELRCFFGQ